MDSSEVLQPQKETEVPDSGGTEIEDIPSDFFDEFNKEEFIEGLSIIDSWGDGIPDSVGAKNSSKASASASFLEDISPANDKISVPEQKVKASQSPNSQLDEFIKPGSRRDPSKTNKAIKKDKEVKLKEFLAKSLESSDDLRPPGTELDEYFDDAKPLKKDKTPAIEKEIDSGSQARSRSREHRPRDSSFRTRDSPLKTSYRQKQRSPRRSPRRSPHHASPMRRSPLPFKRPYQQQWWRPNSPQVNNYRPRHHWSPNRRSPRRSSPRRSSPHRSPRRSPRRSARKSPRRSRRSRSRSPYKRDRRSRSRSPLRKNSTDRFLYPAGSMSPSYAPAGRPFMPPSPFPPGSMPGDPMSSGPMPGGPGYAYGTGYNYNSNSSYDYGGQPPGGVVPPLIVPGPQPSAPGPSPHMPPLPHIPMPPNPVPAPVMVPAPNSQTQRLPSPVPSTMADHNTPYDALAKLVAEGKISQADYLKLAPNKGPSKGADNHKNLVLQRCNSAVTKLQHLHLPSHLMMNNLMGGQGDAKFIAPQYCSPLKRQVPIEFLFTKANVSATAQQNKHLVDSIIATLPDLQKVITRPKKKPQKNMKDAAVQTTRPFCDVCEIRENTQFLEVSTSIDPAHFCSSVHTQVMDQDLINSKSVFTPSGGSSEGAQMSIAHLTPAQLVSQLAARAKTLKQTDFPVSNQYQRNPSNSYNYEGQQYQNYNNYRY